MDGPNIAFDYRRLQTRYSNLLPLVDVCDLSKSISHTSPLVELIQSIEAPDLTSQNRYLILSSVHGPNRRLSGISIPSETSVFRSQLHMCQTDGPSISCAKSQNPEKSISR